MVVRGGRQELEASTTRRFPDLVMKVRIRMKCTRKIMHVCSMRSKRRIPSAQALSSQKVKKVNTRSVANRLVP
jgi:hypothetical protein